jgi:SSS family transporter
MFKMTTLFTVILIMYLILMIVIGFFGAKKSKSTEDYLLAGRKLPVWMMAFSVVAGFFGSEVAMGASGVAYSMGWLGGAGIPFGWTVCLLIMGWFFTEKMRKMRVFTISDFFERKYGKNVGILTAAVIVIAMLFWLAALFLGLAKTFTVFLGWNYTISIAVGMGIVLLYTVAGGLWSGVITDIIQFIILSVATLVLAFVSMRVSGGWDKIAQVVPKANLRFIPSDFRMIIFLLWGFLTPVFSGVVSPDGNSRLMAGISPKASRQAALLSAPLYLILGVLCMVIGFAGAVIYPNIVDAELIYPQLALDYLPPVMSAVIMIGLVSVVMSSADSAILASATLMSKNIYQPLTKANSENKSFLFIVRVCVVICGLFALIISFLSAQIPNAMLLLNMITAGIWFTLIPLIWFGFFWKKANKTAALWSLGFCCIFLLIYDVIALTVNPIIYNASELHLNEIPGEIICTPIGIIMFYFIARATYKKDPPVDIVFAE